MMPSEMEKIKLKADILQGKDGDVLTVEVLRGEE